VGAFNWVQSRAACSLESIFHALSEVIDSDIKSANALRRPGPPTTFRMNTEATGKIIVVRTRDMAGFAETVAVVFELQANEIIVKQKLPATFQETSLFVAVPYLHEEGECLLEVGGKSLKLWQVSRKALEDLVFGF
jgi:predicted RNase H-like nuclease (RuvC/YqgF family)